MTETLPILKSSIVERALKLSGIQGVATPASSTMQDEAGILLEMNIPVLESEGIRLGYIKAEDPMYPDLGAPSGIPDWALMPLSAIVADLIYKQVMNEASITLQAQANSLKKTLYPIETSSRRRNPLTPAGAGNNSGYGHPQYLPVDEPITVENDGNLGDLTLE